MITITATLLVLGLVLLILGITRNTGFKDDFREGMGMFFFILGILHLAGALFTFFAPVPLGAVINATSNYSTDYSEVMNAVPYCVNTTWFNASDPTNATWACAANYTTNITGVVTTEYAYATEANQGIGGLFFYVWLFGLTFYSMIYGLSYLKRAYEGKIS